MQLAALQRWHWIVIGLLIGSFIGLMRKGFDTQLTGPYINGYGYILTDQHQFESGLIQDYNGMRLFDDATVYPHWITDAAGNGRLVHVVAGRYWNGRQELKDGKYIAQWLPTCFIASTPYRPQLDVRSANGAAGPQEYPSVLEFLAALHSQYKVNYSYAWWAAYPVLSWMIVCVLLIGGAWPTLINLLAFGTLHRPPDIKPISLWNIRKAPQRKLTTAAGQLISGGPDETDAMLDVPVSSTEGPPAPAAPALAGGPLDALTEAEREAKDFGADPDDYYPTERHGRPVKKP